MLKSELVYVAEDYGIKTISMIEWFIAYCEEYHSDLVWHHYPMTYCLPDNAEYLANSFKEYIKYLEDNAAKPIPWYE
jgi:hypothetical protein